MQHHLQSDKRQQNGTEWNRGGMTLGKWNWVELGTGKVCPKKIDCKSKGACPRIPCLCPNPQERTDITSNAVACLTLRRGEAPTLCLAQPNGLGKQTEKNMRASGPAVCLRRCYGKENFTQSAGQVRHRTGSSARRGCLVIFNQTKPNKWSRRRASSPEIWRRIAPI